MSSQRKSYLRHADAATEPRSKLFYKLMAEIAPVANEIARKNINQHGADAVYEAVLRTAAAIVTELEFNLTRGGAIDPQRLADDFKLMVQNCVKTQQVGGAIPVPPKMQA